MSTIIWLLLIFLELKMASILPINDPCAAENLSVSKKFDEKLKKMKKCWANY